MLLIINCQLALLASPGDPPPGNYSPTSRRSEQLEHDTEQFKRDRTTASITMIHRMRTITPLLYIMYIIGAGTTGVEVDATTPA
jgi:hypothetical protein